MALALFTPEQEEIIRGSRPITKIVNFYRDDLPKDSFDHDIDEDVKDNFRTLLSALSNTRQARLIRLADSLDSLADRLHRLANALFEQTTFPTTLRPYCSSLLVEVASPNASDLDIWTAVAQLLVAFDSPRLPSTPSTPTTPPEGNSTNIEAKSPALRKLHENWTSDYLPESLDGLQKAIQDNEIRMKQSASQFYAKTLTFVQSSGMGKSRLADAFGKECPMINFVLREGGTVGYPPADSEVLSFVRKRLSEQDHRKITDSPKKMKLSSKRITEEDKKMIMNSPSSKMLRSLTTKSPRPKEVMEPPPEPEKSGIPRADNEIFLESMVTTLWNHSIAVGLLQASFEVFNAWVQQQNPKMSLKELAATRHKMMAPYEHNSRSAANWHLRSNNRTDFCRSVVSRAEKIVNSLIQNQDWRHTFHDDRDSQVRFTLELNDSLGGLLGEAEKLKENLERFQHGDNEPLLVMVFDEASSLLKLDNSDKPDPGRYHALNRIISRLKKLPMWFFFLSTESQVGILIPANDVERTGNFSSDPSARIAIADGPPLNGLPSNGLPLGRFPPFLSLQLDVEDRKRMLKPDSQIKELHKKMNEFTQPKHMAMFGRPLWFGYSPGEMNRLAKLKLVGGSQGTPYNPKDADHVFAALSFRLSLDVCLQNPRTLSLARTAVNSFLRVVISMNQDTGVLDTITPSEPIVAMAAMEYLCEKSNWSDSIRTLTEELLDRGLIDKGLKGELYSRFILILARDWLQINPSLPESVPQLRAMFTVQQFLEALYDQKHHESVQLIPRKILEARMNFNHFVPTNANLTAKVIPELLHDLLRRSAALQLAHDQPMYDKLIPIYFGNPDEPFEVSCCGVILVQDKNRDRATTPGTIFDETFTEVNPGSESQPMPEAANSQDSTRDGSVLNGVKNPVLFLLFDLGIIRKPKATSAPVQVSRTSGKNPDIWAIHSRGHDRTVFGCLDHMNCGDNSEKFFTSLEAEKNTLYELSQRNKVFSKLERDFRYSGFEVYEPGVKRKRGGDEDIESRDEDGDTRIKDV